MVQKLKKLDDSTLHLIDQWFRQWSHDNCDGTIYNSELWKKNLKIKITQDEAGLVITREYDEVDVFIECETFTLDTSTITVESMRVAQHELGTFVKDIRNWAKIEQDEKIW